MNYLLRNSLLEIVETGSLNNSKGEKLSGKELKTIIIETKEERIERHKAKKRSSTDRHSQLLPVNVILVEKELREVVDSYREVRTGW